MEKNDQKHMATPEGKNELTRRQFLSYALGGTGAFMAAAIGAPLLTFGLAPLKTSGSSNMVGTGHKVNEFNGQDPKLISFKLHVNDGWNSKDVQKQAYVIQQGDKLLVMSPICTHLGCLVSKATPQWSQGGKWYFHCPCHNSLFDKYGVQSPDSPATRPLDLYTYDVRNGELFVSGQMIKRG
ncbi:QcrA and Rieske domain-containing protein [Kyrpidia spormannii]|uniref:Rieske (2Fe-2S) iron-sulfur domain protein n=3 Tax=Kyrpidia spormannii TaxID=2055160 RepID=A0A6F9EAS0_9BACL|nr:ubiquinol-cytochrome c reductase iron-sulfur subunit [Kyrpidia spormannii]CAB3393935.1 menaquinol:cytochrome c oxidoreductase (iron-sulfur subunit) [Kyrpidia spormannii]CAB3394857.1 Rieske (2Fe-2S) iron-sulfur domain protein [Kyrpidia spormannii]